MRAPAASPPDLGAAATASGFELDEGGRESATTLYLDTFDGRLFGAGMVLSASRSRYEVTLCLSSADGVLLQRLNAPELPAFGADLPPGAMHDAVAKATGVRRLLARVTLTEQVHHLEVRDRRRKLIGRLRLRAGEAVGLEPADPRAAGAPHPAPVLVELDALRGFDRPAGRLADALVADERVEPAASPYAALMQALGQSPGGYSGKVSVALEADAPVQRSVSVLLGAYLEQIRLNEAGARADLDAEFLHDYRVALRRTRSILSRLRRVYPDAALAPFREAFSRLGSLTGPVRDLDVYLEGMPAFRSGLPLEDGAALDPFEAFLARRQKRAQRRLARELALPWVQTLLDDWQVFLAREGDTPSAQAGVLAGRTTMDVASEVLWKQFRRVRKAGRAITPDSPADPVHRLRIDCKKLRYLLDGFASLYDAEGIGRMVRAMKQLQDNLGAFNDFEVQRHALRGFAREMADEGSAPPETLVALGRLVERMAVGQARERERFHKRWARFDVAEVRDFAEASFSTLHDRVPLLDAAPPADRS